MTAFDTAWGLMKAPYEIIHEPSDPLSSYHEHEQLYQGAKRGMPDTGYWTPELDTALAYAIFGSQMLDREMHEGEPILRIAPKTDKIYQLEQDEGHSGAGFTQIGKVPDHHSKSPFPDLQFEEMDSGEMWRLIEGLMERNNSWDYPIVATSASEHNNEARQAHIDELIRRWRP
tara:strand:+ start:79 stop:597 length:519 start_codon:yes stop_codon:yes gene_type:complete